MLMPTVLENFVAQMRCQSEMTVSHDAGLIIVRLLTYAQPTRRYRPPGNISSMPFSSSVSS